MLFSARTLRIYAKVEAIYNISYLGHIFGNNQRMLMNNGYEEKSGRGMANKV